VRDGLNWNDEKRHLETSEIGVSEKKKTRAAKPEAKKIGSRTDGEKKAANFLADLQRLLGQKPERGGAKCVWWDGGAGKDGS